ncbi:hypothetical protein PUMCH_002623 [Australozyma saopauloensis]|uniref:Serine/threonine-protein kinase SCH9 n=1 Tax=Australozyma saopauloensis TaxID=291208 RepID=A0AAX4HAB9_9ASCO|nr:hypothetical protein PUMCH_002623 [[Candida] saopauloensis]
MSDFAKTILGFGPFSKREATPPNYSDDLAPPLPQVLHHAPNEPHGSSKFLPKNLASTPTTAVSSQSLAYGTTTLLAEQNSSQGQKPGAFLSDLLPYYSNDPQQSHFGANVSAAQEQQHHLLQQQHHYGTMTGAEVEKAAALKSEYELGVAKGVSSSTSSGSSTQPVIITTDESGHAQDSKTSSQPKGKLRVSIMGARDLLVSEFSQPYIVSTFESSEYVNNSAPTKSPMPKRGLPMTQPKDKRPALYQRQASHFNVSGGSSDQVWNHEAVFDVVGTKSELEISVYDAAKDDAFLGQVRISPNTESSASSVSSDATWFPLHARIVGERVTGALQIKWEFTYYDSKKLYGPDDFEVLRLLGKGTFGRVYQVRNQDNSRIYAMKILSKKLIVKKKEIAHTIGERNILVRTSAAASPFIVGLKFSFQTPTDLYLVTDYMSGGELFWHLQKEGRFSEDRAKFYIAELVLALEHLHDNDIVYRDLKPENILLDANGHIALCDFGLSKANLNNDGTTNTFCGTTEYLAPEVLLDESGYTKMVDFWSLGVLIFEMCCGWSPFYADNTQQMYKNIAFGKVRFPKEVLSQEGRSFVKGLLNRNPKHRLGALNDARELKEHPFFQDIDWNLLKSKNIPPPFKPHLLSETDTSNFDPEFTNESTSVLKNKMDMGSTPLSPGIQANFKGFTYVDASAIDDHFGKSHRHNQYRTSESFIPGNPNLPPDDEVIEDQIDEEDEMDIDLEHNMESEEFVNGRFDL